MAHLVVTRRCNLSCGYCYEADRTSAHVPITALRERIGHLRRLNTCFVTLTGGEPLLHPDAVELVAHTRSLGMTPVMNSNVYPLTRERIVALGRAGLYALQTSIDNVEPDGVTRKSLRPMLPKLELLAEHATFRVRVNTVLGSGPPAVAVQVARAAIALGFATFYVYPFLLRRVFSFRTASYLSTAQFTALIYAARRYHDNSLSA